MKLPAKFSICRIQARYTAEEKEQFIDHLSKQLRQLNWDTKRHKYYLATVCKYPKVALMAHFDTGRTLPTFLSKSYEIFGYQYRVHIISSTLLLLSLLTLCVPAFSLPILTALIVSFFLRGKNPINYNDNTSGILLLLEIAKTIPHLQDQVQLVFTDDEERSRRGAKEYKKKAPSLLLNFDSIGLGDTLIISTNNAPPPTELMRVLDDGRYEVKIKRRFSNSDYREFERGIGFTFVKKSFFGNGYYLPNAHTIKDSIIDCSNIRWLAMAINQYLSTILKNP